ncbi:MAG: iron ABC transporter permease [Cellvibrionales bacterium]|nr:iron ABC transporter permease [Cellvibrionales bacterium]
MAMNSTRFRLCFIAMGLTLLAIVLSGITVGPADITWRDTASALLAGIARLLDRIDGLPITEAVSWQDTIIWQVRLPRVLVAVFVGAALATSGAVLQGLFRNPLASSDTLGVSSGASLGGVLAIYLGLTTTTIWALPILAFVGATLSLLLVYSIASERGQAPVATLLLAGIAVGSLNVAASSLVQALALEKWEVGKSIVYWNMGGLDRRTWHHVALIAPLLTIGLLVTLAHCRELDILLAGETQAAAVGVNITKTRLILLAMVSLLIAGSVSVAGGVGFVGLVVPHIVRLATGPHHRHLIPLSALGGALMLAGADWVLRVGWDGNDIPVGIFTAAMGAPFFLWLLYRGRRQLFL